MQCVVAFELDLLGAAFELASSRQGHNSLIHAFWATVDRDTITHSVYGVLWDGARILSAPVAKFLIWYVLVTALSTVVMYLLGLVSA